MSNLIINANSIYDRVIKIGRQTENLVSSITFNVQMWIEEYGLGECVLNVRRNGDGNAYLVPMTIVNGITTWTITDVDTAHKGRGEIQLKYTVGEKVKTSPIFEISCGESLIGDGEPPSGYEDWLSELNRMTFEVEAAKTSASASAQTAQTAAGTAAEKASEAEQSATTASGFAVNASASAESANTSAQAAAQSAQAASVARTAAESAAISAQAEAEDAEAAKTAAEQAETNAHASEQIASESATQAAESAAQAQESATDAQSEADRAKTYADRAAEVELEIPTRVSQLENDAGYLTEHQSLDDYVRKDVLYDMLPVDTASGSIASFPDGADDVPLKSLVVNIEPVQDLHGQDAPYPAGGGKNRYNSAETVWANGFLDDNGSPVSSTASHYTQNFTAVNAESAYILSGSVSSPNVQIRIYFYTANKEWISRTSGTSASTCAFTTPTNCSFIRVQVGTAVTSTSDWQIESGSTATNYAPYSNICPISGWTGAKIEKRGKNLLAKPVVYIRSAPNTLDECFFMKAGNYILSVESITGAASWRYGIRLKDASGNNLTADKYRPQISMNWSTNSLVWIGGANVQSKKQTMTLIEDCYIRIVVAIGDTSASTVVNNAMLEEGSNGTAYEPYNGLTIPITLESEAGTVYGGTLDVLTGVLTVTKGFIQSYNGEPLPSTWISDRDVYAQGATPTTGAEVCYTLVEPITYQSTPHEVKSLLGQNNIYADTGDTTVEYRADTSAYVAKKIAEAIDVLS